MTAQAPRVEHELHKRRRSRNVGLGLVLLASVFLIMGMTYVKLTAQNAALAEERAKEAAAATGTGATASEGENN